MEGPEKLVHYGEEIEPVLEFLAKEYFSENQEEAFTRLDSIGWQLQQNGQFLRGDDFEGIAQICIRYSDSLEALKILDRGIRDYGKNGEAVDVGGMYSFEMGIPNPSLTSLRARIRDCEGFFNHRETSRFERSGNHGRRGGVAVFDNDNYGSGRRELLGRLKAVRTPGTLDDGRKA